MIQDDDVWDRPDRDGPAVLRLCSVFEPESTPAAPGHAGGLPGEIAHRAARFDPIGGMQNHTAALTRCLDAQGARQTVLTARLAAPRGTSTLGRRARVVRTGLPVPFLRQLWALGALPRALRPDGPVDVVHAHQGEDVAVLPLGLLAARRHGCPLVVTLHCSVRHTLRGGSLRARLLRRFGGAVERAVVRRADAVVVLTPHTAAALVRDGVRPATVRTIPSGYDPQLFDVAPGTDLFPALGRPRIGYVGRLAPQKAPGLLVEAFAGMRQDAELVVVGDGPERARVEALVAASGRSERVTMAGFVRHDVVPSVLASLDVLVLPSAYEEMGSVLTEAMASGLPVVACAVGGIPEVVRDGETGLLVPPGDADALAEALDLLVADPVLRARLAAGARRRAAEYTWPSLAARVAGVYTAARRSHGRLLVAVPEAA